VTNSAEPANWEIFLWALSELGGDADVRDVEEVYLRSFELAPNRFSWRTRSDLPDYKKCAKALRDAEARSPALLVKTGDKYGRQLTVEGQTWVAENRTRLQQLLGEGAVVQAPKRRPSQRVITNAEASPTFVEWSKSGALPLERWRLAEFFRCLPDSPPSVWRHRLETLRSAANAADRKALLAFLDEVSVSRSAWFEGSEAYGGED
jgi:hypothetical protein